MHDRQGAAWHPTGELLQGELPHNAGTPSIEGPRSVLVTAVGKHGW